MHSGYRCLPSRSIWADRASVPVFMGDHPLQIVRGMSNHITFPGKVVCNLRYKQRSSAFSPYE